jgi:C-terminal processing protease CtpA/Prc
MNIIKQIILLLEKNYIFYKQIIKESILTKVKKIDKLEELDEPLIANIIYDIISKYDKHFSFSPIHTKKISNKKKWIHIKIMKNRGIIKIDEFPDYELTKQYEQKTIFDISKIKRKLLSNYILNNLNKIEKCDTIIFDLRDNSGGDDQIVILILSFIFAKKIHINTNIFKNEKRFQYTLSKKEVEEVCECDTIPWLNQKKIYVIINKNTFSAAEFFAYTLQTFKIAIIVGKENSGGGANGGDYYKINKNMKMFIPYFYSKNPITKTNWNITGVKPDIII